MYILVEKPNYQNLQSLEKLQVDEHMKTFSLCHHWDNDIPALVYQTKYVQYPKRNTITSIKF